MTEDIPNQVPLTTACNVCGSPIHTHHDEDAPAWVLTTLLRSIACENCIGRADGKAMAKRAGERLEVRSLTWETLCPHEFRKPIDFKLARRADYDAIMAWTFGDKGLFVHGITGRCKTRYLFAVMHREHLEGASCAFAAHADFRREVTFLAQTDAVAMRRYMAVLTRADIVLFDDLGNGLTTPASEEAFEMVIAKRARDGKPILYSSNFTTTQLAKRFTVDRAEPICRRISEFTREIKL